MASHCFIDAAKNGDLTTVEQYIKKNGNVEAKEDCYGKTALMMACQHGYLEIVRYLINEGNAALAS
jgi:ankyrin repeat protein